MEENDEECDITTRVSGQGSHMGASTPGDGERPVHANTRQANQLHLPSGEKRDASKLASILVGPKQFVRC